MGCLGVTAFLAAAASTNDLMEVSAPWIEGGEIPARYTCDSGDAVPEIHWTGIPPKAKTLALVVDDLDTPSPSSAQSDFVNWILYDIPAASTGLDAAALPAGTRAGRNDWKATGYRGPCAPSGQHRYFVRLYALDVELPAELGTPTRTELDVAMRGHIVGQAEHMGTYGARPTAPQRNR
jgi:Raf kinase inhibitor-like YbhB/YbcL family protein